jgi:hypothetical protein
MANRINRFSHRELDHFLVFVVIGLEPFRELLGRHDQRIERLALQFVAYVGHFENLVGLGIQFVDDRFGCPGWREHADPRSEFVAWNAGFGDRWDLRKGVNPVIGRDRKRPHRCDLICSMTAPIVPICACVSPDAIDMAAGAPPLYGMWIILIPPSRRTAPS